MITERKVGGPAYLETIKEMERDLIKVIKDFDHAVDVEAICLVKKSGRRSLSQSSDTSFSVVHIEQKVLLKQLKCVKTGYNRTLCCMEGTRESLLHHIKAWVTNGPRKKNLGNTYWIFGLPGIGKTALAHSICANLHDKKHLTGGFFCRRDDPNMGKPRNILLTLIYKLAKIFPPFWTIVAGHLRSDTNLTPESMRDTLFQDFICTLPCHPQCVLIFVIDALDECGDSQSHRVLLKSLTNAATNALWLKLIITSRPEVNIQCFFDDPARSSHLHYDLAADANTTSDL